MTDFYKAIYSSQADKYDRMVAHEDFQGNISRALESVRPLKGLEVIELGAGTGRLTRLIAPQAKRIWAFDISRHMLSAAASRLTAAGLGHWATAVADNRRLPVPPAAADLVIAGWTLGHSVGWHPLSWQDEIGRALAEMKRVARPSGARVILETLGTGRETPRPPSAGLAAFYTWLETEHGFHRDWIRTDYLFDSPVQAAGLTRFFFGDELADRILEERITLLPECTGVWTCTA
jgi:ubiquinone/menaquinone biosynthesis C-methylase UbiE